MCSFIFPERGLLCVEFKTNINDYVKVKLTDYGISILEQQHNVIRNEIKEYDGKNLGEFKVNIDKDGYIKFQLHELMHHFGHITTVANKIPFETEIIITKGEQI